MDALRPRPSSLARIRRVSSPATTTVDGFVRRHGVHHRSAEVSSSATAAAQLSRRALAETGPVAPGTVLLKNAIGACRIVRLRLILPARRVSDNIRAGRYVCRSCATGHEYHSTTSGLDAAASDLYAHEIGCPITGVRQLRLLRRRVLTSERRSRAGLGLLSRCSRPVATTRWALRDAFLELERGPTTASSRLKQGRRTSAHPDIQRPTGFP